MPFEIAQPQVETEVGPYQNVADAMLRGCLTTEQVRGKWEVRDEQGRIIGACAMGAVLVGNGGMYPMNVCQAFDAYKEKYGIHPISENDSGGVTREQIAARIAALR